MTGVTGAYQEQLAVDIETIGRRIYLHVNIRTLVQLVDLEKHTKMKKFMTVKITID